MKKTALPLVLLPILLAAAAATAGAGDARTLKGEFIWNQWSGSGDLEAVFTPSGEERWNVSFHFEFRGEPHTYSGTAEGSLTEGSLSGTVKNENEKRTFTFTGAFEGGRFEGTHSETTGGRVVDTGTLTLGG